MGSIKCKEMIKVLSKFGYNVVRQTGSHKILKHYQTNQSFVVSANDNESIGRPLISKILRWAGIEKDQFISNL